MYMEEMTVVQMSAPFQMLFVTAVPRSRRLPVDVHQCVFMLFWYRGYAMRLREKLKSPRFAGLFVDSFAPFSREEMAVRVQDLWGKQETLGMGCLYTPRVHIPEEIKYQKACVKLGQSHS